MALVLPLLGLALALALARRRGRAAPGASSASHGDRVRRVAVSMVGLDAGADSGAFTAALGPAPPDGWGPILVAGAGEAHASTCAIVARAILLRAGCTLSPLRAPYAWGIGISDVLAAAPPTAIVRTAGAVPSVGDLVVWENAARHHVATVVAVTDSGVTTVDGGLVSAAGYQRIGTVARALADVTIGSAQMIVRVAALPFA